MTAESINPYASPVIPADEVVAARLSSMVVEFTMDAAQQWECCRMARTPFPVWVQIVAPTALLAIGYLLVGAETPLSVLVAIGVFVVIAIAQTYNNRRRALEMLDLLRLHTVLGATGPWRITVDQRRFIVETRGGRRAFARAKTRVQCLEAADLVICFDDLPIVIPESAPYTEMCRSLRIWLITTAAEPIV